MTEFPTDGWGDLLDGMRDRPVLVVGDWIADEYVFGETSRVSREAPVLIIRHVGRKIIPGGAGNAVLNLRALGARPIPIGVIGAGPLAEEVIDALARREIDGAGVLRDAGRETIRKTRVMAGGAHGQKQQILRIDREDLVPLSPAVADRLRDAALARIEEVDAVLFSDYGYGTIVPRVRDEVLAAARRRGIPVCADSRYDLRAFRGVTYATPNESEAEQLWGRAIRSAEDLRAASHALREDLGAEFLLLTRGRDGMAVAEKDGSLHEIPVWGSAEAADVTGAGDTVAAVSLLAIAGGASPREAARLATVAAGVVVQKHGAATTSPEEIERVVGIARQSPHR
jgi:rfaE bifunctional protein kinase chain/domain